MIEVVYGFYDFFVYILILVLNEVLFIFRLVVDYRVWIMFLYFIFGVVESFGSVLVEYGNIFFFMFIR